MSLNIITYNLYYEKFQDGTVKEIEVPYDIPLSWKWIRLNKGLLINPRNKLVGNLDVSFIPMSLINDGFTSVHKSELKTWEQIKSGFTHFQNKDVVMEKITPSFQNRKSAILTNLKNGFGAGTTEIYTLRPLSGIESEYLFYFINTRQFILDGIKNFTGNVGQQRVPRYFISECLFPLPPVEEQKHIIKQINKYFSLIEIIDINQQSFKQLSDQLKRKVLDTAMRGKLVPQNSNDEPTSVMLRKISKEKQKQYEKGKLKKRDLQDSIIYKSDDNSYCEKIENKIKKVSVPYQIPESWEWRRLASIIQLISGHDLSKKKYHEGQPYGIPYITGASNFQNVTLTILFKVLL